MIGSPKPVLESILGAADLAQKIPEIEGVPSGVEGLDNLFYTVVQEGGKPVVKPLGGLPRRAAVHVTGTSDTGKSLFAEQYALAQAARGEGVVFVTVETPAPFVDAGLEQRRLAMGLERDVLAGVTLVDAASHGVLREDLPTLFATLDAAFEATGARHLVVDSLTGLYEAREMTARLVVRKVYLYTKEKEVTAVFTSQKRSSHEELSAEAAGGYAVSHILDATIVLAKRLVMTQAQSNLWGVPLGEVVRFLRIDGCRLSGHDSKTHYLELLPEGLLRVGPPIGSKDGQPGSG